MKDGKLSMVVEGEVLWMLDNVCAPFVILELFLFHISSSCVGIRLYTQNQLSRLSGSVLFFLSPCHHN